ncbi:MAG: hypothetical protein ACRDVW_05225 [Acidimicrobiales bacterium]
MRDARRSRRASGPRRWIVAISLAAPAALVGCSSVHQSLGTSDGPCYVALPNAVEAVGQAGHLDGVRLMEVGSLEAMAPLRTALSSAGVESGRVCLVAFDGDFSASSVSSPSGLTSGHLAVVVLGYPDGKLVKTVLMRRLPTQFGHSHFG